MNTFSINNGLIMQKLNKKIVIFDGEKSVMYSLNETASQMFLYLKKGWDMERIAEKIAITYAIDKKQAYTDVNQLIENLTIKKIIQVKKINDSE